MSNVKSYVVGFLFSEDRRKLALIRKTHPQWQAGLLNGIGGKVEENENVYGAMAREFEEEAGVKRHQCSWELFCTISGDDGKYPGSAGSISGDPFIVYFFYAVGDVSKLKSMTDEKVTVIYVDTMYKEDVVSNLKWLIPMALSMNQTPTESYNIRESYE